MTTVRHHPDPDLLDEFYLDFSDAHQTCETILLELEQHPDDRQRLNTLFRAVHTIKGNLVYVGLKVLTPIIQAVEDVLDAVRQGRMRYDSVLSDIVLVAMDQTKQWVEACVHQSGDIPSEATMDALCQQISSLVDVAPDKRETMANQTLLALHPASALPTPTDSNDELNDQPDTAGTSARTAAPSAETATSTATLAHSPPPKTTLSDNEILARYGIPDAEDLAFFQALATPLESRSRYWRGRSARMLQLGLDMNERAGCPVEPLQLATAIYLHDLGMAFLPLELLHKTTPLNEEERELLHQHPQKAYQLLAHNRDWQQAATIILHHHERLDGSGYPAGLRGDAITPGARLLSILDTFDARTHERAHTSGSKRPFIRALLEINRCAGNEFDADWVALFNESVRELTPGH